MERSIESRVLLYVVTVAEDGNITRAAKTKLFIAPGSLARDIRNLEKRIGYPLFTRRWGWVALTPAGTVFVEEARKSLDHSQRAADRGAAASRRETGTLNVAKEFERQYSGFVPRWPFNQSSNRTQRRRKHTMKKQDFTTSFTVDQSPDEVFKAINNVAGWWSGDINGRTDKLGAEFTYQYKDMHKSTQQVTEFVPGKRIVWHVKDAELTFVKDKTEWLGTDIVFEITRKGGKTELRFTHVGLVPAFECYGGCSGAWGALVEGNLQKLITTGKGQPDVFA